MAGTRFSGVVRARFFHGAALVPVEGDHARLGVAVVAMLGSLRALVDGYGEVSAAVSRLASNLLDPAARAPVQEVVTALVNAQAAGPSSKGLERLGSLEV
jgi:hypothetical protein